jgi:ATP-binding cassette subfamily D (ALD) long-chain fatty acid import protein
VILGDMYRRLVDHIHSVFKIRIPYGMTEDFVIKYAWSAAGYGLMSIPILTGAKTDVAHRTESYVSNRRLLLSLADAGGRLMYSGKDLAELSGYTGRVYSLLASLHALDHGDYPPSEGVYDMGNIRGRVILGRNHLVLKGVPVVAPSGGDRGGEELIQSLDLVVEKGDHTLITGPK